MAAFKTDLNPVIHNSAFILAGGYGIKAFFGASAASGSRTVSQRVAAQMQERSATVMGGGDDAITNFISSLGPQQTTCRRH